MASAHHTTDRSTRHASDSTASQQPSKPNASNQTVANATVQLFEQANDDSDELLLQYDVVDPEPVHRANHARAAVDTPITVHVFGAVRVEGATRPLTDIETELVTLPRHPRTPSRRRHRPDRALARADRVTEAVVEPR